MNAVVTTIVAVRCASRAKPCSLGSISLSVLSEVMNSSTYI